MLEVHSSHKPVESCNAARTDGQDAAPPVRRTVFASGRWLAAAGWLCIVALLSPIWFGIAYMDSTGHSKGYGYDLGSDADISVMIGIVEWALWAAAALPAFFYVTGKCCRVNRKLAFLPILLFVLLFALTVTLIGWKEYFYVFGV